MSLMLHIVLLYHQAYYTFMELIWEYLCAICLGEMMIIHFNMDIHLFWYLRKFSRI